MWKPIPSLWGCVPHWWITAEDCPELQFLFCVVPGFWRTSRGSHHQFQAAARIKDLWTMSSLPQTLAVPLWSYSYASAWPATGDTCAFIHACVCVPAVGQAAAHWGWVGGCPGCLRPELGNPGCACTYHCKHVYFPLTGFHHGQTNW